MHMHASPSARWILLLGLALASASTVAQTIVIREAPPPPRHELVPPPRPGYIWTPGRYTYQGRHYVWVEGSWMRARPGYRYHPGGWEHRGRGWGWREGGWGR